MDDVKNKMLAEELVKELDDEDDYGYYLTLAKKYSHDLLREVARWVSDYPNPSHKGKLFTWKFKSVIAERSIHSGEINDRDGLERIKNLKSKFKIGLGGNNA